MRLPTARRERLGFLFLAKNTGNLFSDQLALSLVGELFPDFRQLAKELHARSPASSQDSCTGAALCVLPPARVERANLERFTEPAMAI